jgi:ferredoxin--NADP+ reductase
MAGLHLESVVRVRHWNDTRLSCSTTREPSLRFGNEQFLMLGLEVGARPLPRARIEQVED